MALTITRQKSIALRHSQLFGGVAKGDPFKNLVEGAGGFFGGVASSAFPKPIAATALEELSSRVLGLNLLFSPGTAGLQLSSDLISGNFAGVRGKIQKATNQNAEAILAYVGLRGLGGVGWVFGRLPGWLTRPLFCVLGIGVVGSLPALYQNFVQSVSFIANFNWNITDKQLTEQLTGQLNQLYSLTGGVVGRSLGYLVCGALPGTLAFAFNPVVAAAIFQELGEEAKDEICAQLTTIKQTSFRLLVNQALAQSFMGTRRWLKRPDSPFYGILKSLLGENFTKWGDANRPAFTINGAIEERIESIKDPKLRSFVEEAYEEFTDACVEAGEIVVEGWAASMAVNRLTQTSRQRVVELTFNPVSSS